MGDSVRLSGFKELPAAIEELGKGTGKNVLRRTGKRMLEPMRASAEAKARKRTGALKRAVKIGTRLAKSQGGGKARHVGGGQFRSDPKNDVTMHMGPGQEPQAITEEFGPNGSPFMRPAFDEEAPGAIRAAGDMLWEEISKAAARAARKAARSAK